MKSNYENEAHHRSEERIKKKKIAATDRSEWQRESPPRLRLLTIVCHRAHIAHRRRRRQCRLCTLHTEHPNEFLHVNGHTQNTRIDWSKQTMTCSTACVCVFVCCTTTTSCSHFRCAYNSLIDDDLNTREQTKQATTPMNGVCAQRQQTGSTGEAQKKKQKI